jgi:carbamoyl-phosphate synthase large subunit
MSIKRKPVVLVTGAGSYCAVNIIKSLKSTGKYRIIATDIFPNSVGVFRSDKGFIVPREGTDGEFISALLKICESEFVDVLIPGFDSEIPYILDAKHRFHGVGVKVIIGNKLLVEIGRNKNKLSEFLKNHGFAYLKSFLIDERKKAVTEIPFPMVVKPLAGWGQRGFHIIHSDDEMSNVINALDHREDYFIQEYVDDSEGEFTNSVSVAEDGEILGCVCSKRELVKGDSRKILIDEFPDVRQQMINIAKAIGSPGPINLQCRLRDGIAFVFEINCRFSTTNCVRAACGYNEVELLVDNFLTGAKRHIAHIERKIAIAYLDYVYLDPETVENFEKQGVTSSKASLNVWL